MANRDLVGNGTSLDERLASAGDRNAYASEGTKPEPLMLPPVN
jgi:hypothetical protein